MSANAKNSLTLKWGTVKGWDLHSEEAVAALVILPVENGLCTIRRNLPLSLLYR